MNTSDHYLVVNLLSALGCVDVASVRLVTAECEPRSKARPRFNNGKGFSDKVQKANQDELKLYLRQKFSAPLTGNVAVACLFFRSSRQPIDTDNMLKQVLDAGTHLCWVDDRQVTAVAGVTYLDREDPRVVIAVGPHTSTMVREVRPEVVCLTCKKVFIGRHLSPSQKKGGAGQYCSQECGARSRGEDLSAEVRCVTCQNDFKRQKAGQRHCSDLCRMLAMKTRNTGKRIHPKSVCGSCGKGVSRPEYKTCRACWKG